MSNTVRPFLRVDQLVVGSISRVSLGDVTGRELISKGTTISLALIEEIRNEGVTFLQILPDVDATANPSAQATSSAERGSEQSASKSRLLQPYSADRVEQLDRKFNACQLVVAQMVDSLRHGESVSADDAVQQIDDYVQELSDDPDPVVASALAYQPDLTLEKRCVQLSILCMAIGMAQKLGPVEVQDLGLAGLTHDWSLFDVPPESRFSHHHMTEDARYQFSKHPHASAMLLSQIRGTSEVQRMIVAQVHELLDGSGYPLGISGRKIHPLSRVAGVAEGFLDLTSAPPGAARVVPSDAIAFLIASASKGRYAAASVSALLEATTLFPLGCILELNDTTRVRVIRSNPGKYGYPIVQMVSNPNVIIDLSTSELFITRPVVSSEYDEIRLPDAYKELNSASEG